LTPTLKQRRAMLRECGVLCGPKTTHIPDSTVCLRAIIRSSDKRLVNFTRWHKSHYRHSQPFVGPDVWFYRGDIPASSLTVVKHRPKGLPYYRLYGFPVTPENEDDLLAARIGPPEYVAGHRDVA